MIGLFPAWLKALERLLIHLVVLFQKGLMRENINWLIIVFRKGHAFKMNDAKQVVCACTAGVCVCVYGGGAVIKLWAVGGGAWWASSGINSTFRGELPWPVVEGPWSKNNFAAVRGAEKAWRAGKGGIMTPGRCCVALKSTDREREINSHTHRVGRESKHKPPHKGTQSDSLGP